MPRRAATSDAPTNGETPVQSAIAVFDEDFAKQNLVGKIAHISGYLGAIPKRGYNSFHKYNYVMEADLVGAVRSYLAAAGIVIVPDTQTITHEGDLTTVEVRYTVTDGNESFSFMIPGTGADRGDKGAYKALTGSMKYAIMKLFKIETGDDPEQDTRVDERAAQSESPIRPERPAIKQGTRSGVQRGGHTDLVSPAQLRRISELVKTLELERPLFANLISDIAKIDAFELPDNEDEQGAVILATLRAQNSQVAGQIIEALTTLAEGRHLVKAHEAMDASDEYGS